MAGFGWEPAKNEYFSTAARMMKTPVPTPMLIWTSSLRRITGCSCTTSMSSTGLMRRSMMTALALLVVVVDVAVVAVVAIVLD